MSSGTVVDYYYSHVSPFSFLGHQRLITLSKQIKFDINPVPITIPRIFSMTGGIPLSKRSEQRQEYRLWELKRWSQATGISLNLQPRHFPVDDAVSARMALVAQESGLNILPLSYAFMKAVWQEDKDISEPDTLVAIAESVGYDGEALYSRSQDNDVDMRLCDICETAIKVGIFGAPTYIFDGEPFWGQDRLDMLAQAVEERGKIHAFA